MNESDNSTEGRDLDDALYVPSVSLVVILSLCYGSISVAAVVGNGLVIWVIATSRRMRNVTNYYIANLAVADIVIGLFSIPFEFQSALLQEWRLPHFMCGFCPFFKTVSICVSVFTLSAIALDRYRAILHPLTARVSRMQFRIVVSSIWIVSGLLGAPIAYSFRVILLNRTDDSEIFFCHVRENAQDFMKWYNLFLVFIQYVLPLSVITCAYVSIGLALDGSIVPGNAQSERDANIMRNKKKVIKMLVIVVVLFAICWLPLQTYNVLSKFTEIDYYRYINLFWFLFDWLAMSNSCYNPFIYAIYNEKFKREFQMRLKAPCLKIRKRKRRLTRELSGFESSRTDWKRTSTIKNGHKPLTISVNEGLL